MQFFLKAYGFKQSYSNYFLLTLTKKNIQLNILIYVDDMIIVGNDQEALLNFKSYLEKCFRMKEYFINLEIARGAGLVVLLLGDP